MLVLWQLDVIVHLKCYLGAPLYKSKIQVSTIFRQSVMHFSFPIRQLLTWMDPIGCWTVMRI